MAGTTVAGKKQRLAAVEKALACKKASDALEKLRALVPDDGDDAQEVVVYGYACILETNSAGLSILFERFDDAELEKVRRSLEAIGAVRTLAALSGLLESFASAIAGGKSRLDACEWLSAQSIPQRVDQESETHVSEMEGKLVAFCRARAEELAS